MALQLEEVNMRDARLQYQTGTASALQYRQSQNSYLQKVTAVDTARLNLFQAMETYDWAVKGLVAGN